MLAMFIGLKIDNADFDFNKAEVCANCKERNELFPKRASFIAKITRPWHSAIRTIKLCKAWKFQRMK